MTYQLRADMGTIDQASGDLATYAGAIEDYRESLRAEAMKALGNFGGGAGSQEHEAAMRVVDRLVEEHVASVRRQRDGAVAAGDTFAAAAARMRSVLSTGA